MEIWTQQIYFLGRRQENLQCHLSLSFLCPTNYCVSADLWQNCLYCGQTNSAIHAAIIKTDKAKYYRDNFVDF